MDSHLLKRVLADIAVPDKDFRLNKTLLLRAIESEISEADVTEKLLEIFETIEQLDKTEDFAIMKSMKAAYCAVAVECTVKYLAVSDIDKHGRYFDAVRRIWRGRVTELERSGKSELVSRELKAWNDEIEVTLCNKNVWKKLVKMNTRYDALKLIVDYLGEAWGILGPSFLQLSASLMDKRMTNEKQSIPVEGEVEKMAVTEDACGNGGIELPSQTENYATSERQGSGQESVEEEVEVLHNPSPSRDENLKTSVLPRCKSLASHRCVRGGAKISHPEDLESGSSSKNYTCLQMQDVLKTNHLELEAVVRDPYPNALHMAKSVAHDCVERYKTREHSLEDRNDTGAANPAIYKDVVPLRSVDAHGHQTILVRPSIMERNSTASTSEWNHSIDGSPEINHIIRLHVPSPKRKVIYPLKKYEETNIVRRRKSKKWTLLEEDTLRTGVQRFGKGSWKLILNSYRDIFDERTEVDLKDKWRNMIKY